ncbi:MAG: protein kinase [Acidobacteriia bacterium]|nr:protein kinase [Terriglobia bacterium]
MNDSEANPEQAFSSEEWELVKELVFECQMQHPQDLHSWLAGKSSSDKVRREVERLLRSASTCGDFLQQPAPHRYFGVARKLPERIGRYRVIEEIGSGGMGVVYAAYDEELNRRVAIKVLLAQTAEDPELQKRLRWDAQAASALQHPNIVTVHEVGSDGGSDYVAMECISGKTLGRLIPAGGMETAEALGCAIQIASGLEAAHLAGVVHRDLKPSNIMVTDTGVVKLLDFGLAKGFGAGFHTGDAPPTIEGKFAGTVAYVSPEQAEGKAVDVRSDIFSFGSVLFEMLTSRRAFPGDHAISVLADILHTEPPRVAECHPGIDPQLDEIVQRCLRKNRTRRFQSMGEIRIRLQEVQEELQYAKQDRSAAHIQGARLPSRGMLWGVIIGAAATAALAAGLFLVTRKSERRIVLTRATSDTGLTEYPAISRDNQFLAYASDRLGDGNLNIWMQQVKGSEPVQLTSNPADDYEPVFSPDGTKLLFRSDREGGGLYIKPALAGPERPLAPRGRGGQFSPDGEFIAYWTGEGGASLSKGSASIFIVPASGGSPKPFRPDFLAAAYPVWAPDGDRLLFLGHRDDGSRDGIVDWWVASLDGKYLHATHLLETFRNSQLRPTGYWLIPGAWLGSGNRVLFSATHQDATNIWAVELNGKAEAADVPRRWTAGTTEEMHPSATEVAGHVSLAYSTLTASIDAWRIPLDGHGRAGGPAERLVSGFDGITSPSISFDGSRIVFASKVPEGQAIRMIDLNSGQERIVWIVNARQHSARPILSGDGGTLAYWDKRGGYVIHLPNGVPERICESCGLPTHVSFDGKDVLFESLDSSEQILISSGGKPARPLIQWAGVPPLKQDAARLSPNRRWVVFSGRSLGSAVRHIWIAPVRKEGVVKEDELIPVTDVDAEEKEPYWSPGGDLVYFLSGRDASTCIWARQVDPATEQPRGPAFPVAHFHHARQSIKSPSPYSGDIGLTVNRNSLVLMMAGYTSNVWLQGESSTAR